MVYRYYVSFMHTGSYGFGVGWRVVGLAQKLETADDMIELHESLKKLTGKKELVVLNYQLMKEIEAAA